jgi:hypothetical protein
MHNANDSECIVVCLGVKHRRENNQKNAEAKNRTATVDTCPSAMDRDNAKR